MNKKIALLAVVIVILVIAAAFWLHAANNSTPTTRYPSISNSIISPDNELFYYAGNIYGYNLITNATQTIVSLDPNINANFLERVATSSLAIETGNQTSSAIYMFDTISDKLTNEVNTDSIIDNLDAISPDEFIYSEPTVTSTFGYDNVFLFQNGTTTQIGHFLPPPEYGSQISHSPDGKYLFFADEIYDTGTGKWQPISSNQNCTIGNESAWLKDNVIALLRQDDGGGLLCTYDTTSHAVKQLGYVQFFNVLGNDIFYDAQSTTTPELFQIWDYNYSNNSAHLILPNAQLITVIPALQALIYQPVMPKQPFCDTEDCIGGVASGSLMRFDIGTQKSYPVMTGVTNFGSVF